jgi:hypothetical protein
MTSRENFDAWFAAPIAALRGNEDAGFVLVMVTFPLLERYLKQRTGAKSGERPFAVGLLSLFPELGSVEVAEKFWHVYRHGILHDVTMSHESHGLRVDCPAVAVEANGKVWLNPALFSERVVSMIQSDFQTFSSGRLPLSVVTPYVVGSHTYYGTGMPISASTKRHDS